MLTATEAEHLPYVELLARLSESNRPPGGVQTVRRLAAATHLRPGVTALHAGCNAGFLSRELARRSGARVVGIDVSPAMAIAASRRAISEAPSLALDYACADMRCLPFAPATFDVVLSGGALAFVRGDRELAVREWMRVVRPHGLIADCELFYDRQPPAELLAQLSATIGVSVPQYTLEYWRELFRRSELEPYYSRVSDADLAVSDGEVLDYVERMINRFSAAIDEDVQAVLRRRLLSVFLLFNENMKYLRHVLLVCVVRPPNFEPALFV